MTLKYKAENNRWWEYYVARYLAGNIFAVLMLFYLVTFQGDSIQTSLCSGVSKISQPELCDNGNKFSAQIFGFIFITTKDVNSTNDTDKSYKRSIVQKPWMCFFSFNCDYVFLPVPNKIKSDNSIAVSESGFILNKNSQINITEINVVNVFILGVFGFLYMYIASLPIYYLHITRGAWIGIFSCVESIPIYYQQLIEYSSHMSLRISGMIHFVLHPVTIIISIVASLIYLPMNFKPLSLLLLLLRADKVHDFLKNSTFKRDEIRQVVEDNSKNNILLSFHWMKRLQKKPIKNESYSPEYIESYKHDREHGNAFGVILMEILFAYFLIESQFSIYAMSSWLFLGFSGWFLGMVLEFKMVNNK